MRAASEGKLLLKPTVNSYCLPTQTDRQVKLGRMYSDLKMSIFGPAFLVRAPVANSAPADVAMEAGFCPEIESLATFFVCRVRFFHAVWDYPKKRTWVNLGIGEITK